MSDKPDTSPYTADEIRELVLGQMRVATQFWADMPISVAEKLNGLCFSILNILDGTSSLPAFDLVVRPHPSDKQFRIDEGMRYYPDGTVINGNVMMHDEWDDSTNPDHSSEL